MISKFFDLQFVIGIFLSLIGFIIFQSSFFTITDIQYAHKINLYSGIELALFAAIMLFSFHISTKDKIS